MKITRTVYLTAAPDSFADENYRFKISVFEYDDEITLDSMELTMEVPEGFDINTGHINMLKKEKQKIQAEAHIKAENIEGQIQRLLFIEHKGEE